jgi:DNA-binding transcriptional ArsR family regulator
MENHYPDQDRIFQALSDPTRRSVVQKLAHGAATVSELASAFDVTLPTFMKHLAALETANLISTHKAGRVRTCTLNRNTLFFTEQWFAQQRAIWAGKFDNLDTLLDALNGGIDET